MSMGTHEVLELWERGVGLDPLERAVTLAAAIPPVHPPDDVVTWPLGVRDARLVELQRALGESSFEVVTTCSACGEDIEFGVDAAALLASADAASVPEPVRVEGWEVTWRLVATADLQAAKHAIDAESADAVLVDRCILQAVRSGSAEPASAENAPPSDGVRAAVAEAMAASDPLAEVLVDLACPGCSGEVVADVVIADLVWAEVASRAARLLGEVAVLARAYGWTEPEVLALSDSRREAYLRLARSVAP
jgi:hypothetical protein